MLYGRDTELTRISQLIAETRDDRRSGALVLRGEAGIGKSALLDSAAECATGVRILRAAGADGESELAFAGLLQLLWPVTDRIGALPGPQSVALHAALGMAEARERDRFGTGLAVLTLLADLAEEGPLLCLVDDAQWLDQPTAEVLLFAARRLAAEGVAMLFATREEGFAAHGLPELRLPRLCREDAIRLLTEREVPPMLRERIVAESEGNPLALIEFGLAGREEPSGARPLPVADRVLASFRAQIARLPERTRLMVLTAAAESRRHLPTILGAARTFGVGLEDLEEAERARLLQVTGTTITFRHPLIGTAAYQGAVLARRIAVHKALAEAADDPDCRAVHRAAAATAPDEGVAAGMERMAERFRDRTGYAAASTAYQQAAQLSPDSSERARRLGAAAVAALHAGHAERAGELAERAQGGTTDVAELTRLASVRASVAFERGEPDVASRILVERAAGADRETAVAMLRTGAVYAWLCGDEASVRAAAARLADLGCDDGVVEGVDRLIQGDYARGLPLLAEVTARSSEDPAVRTHALLGGMILGDDDTMFELAAAEVADRRRRGLVGALPGALGALAQAQVMAGRHRDAEASVAEAMRIAGDTGLGGSVRGLGGVLARIAAIEGDEERCREVIGDFPDAFAATAESALALLDLGLGRYDSVLRRLERAWHGPARHSALLLFAAADQVEAAVRADRPDRAAEPLRRFEQWAEATCPPWARAVALRGRALLLDEEELYVAAVRMHGEGGRPFERARTELLYGEWLRRARRRSDARTPLRSALEIFERLRAAPWAERARSELRATGETGAVVARSPAADPLDRLTPQEAQVVRLAAGGTSNRDIAAQLFLSPRTVEYHLYKAYPKLGVSSRRELSGLELGAEPVGDRFALDTADS